MITLIVLFVSFLWNFNETSKIDYTKLEKICINNNGIFSKETFGNIPIGNWPLCTITEKNIKETYYMNNDGTFRPNNN